MVSVKKSAYVSILSLTTQQDGIPDDEDELVPPPNMHFVYGDDAAEVTLIDQNIPPSLFVDEVEGTDSSRVGRVDDLARSLAEGPASPAEGADAVAPHAASHELTESAAASSPADPSRANVAG